MYTPYFRSLLWLTVATVFLFSCQKQEKDQIKPAASKNSKSAARLSSVLYEQPLAPELEPFESSILLGRAAEDFIVPPGETWLLQSFAFYGYTEIENPTFSFSFYYDDGGKPGEVLPLIFLGFPGTVVEEFTTAEGRPVQVIQIDYIDYELDPGKYWFAITSQEGNTYWYTSQEGIEANYVTTNDNYNWTSGLGHLGFALLGIVGIQEVSIENVLTELGTYLDNRAITGIGTGRTAENHLRTFRSMLETARELIEADDLASACAQLTDAQRRIHTTGPIRPDHFITGSSASDLYNLISELKADLGCP
jgi:hypothetical protein